MYRDLELAVMEAVGIFQLFQWKWSSVDGPDYIPNSDNIRQRLEELELDAIKEAKENESGLTYISTGRLTVMANYDKTTKELEVLYMVELG